jgi:hypothetical protein
VPSLSLWTAMLNDAFLPLLGVTSLLLVGRRNSGASLLVAYWVVTLRSSSVVYLKMSLCFP